jgi:hypothetical protein
MSPDDSLLLILRRLDEIERKLDQVLEELRAPTAIGYSARRGSFPTKDGSPASGTSQPSGLGRHWPQRTNLWRKRTNPQTWPEQLSDIGPKV